MSNSYYANKILCAIEDGLEKQCWLCEMLVSRCNWQRVTEASLVGEVLEALVRIASKELDNPDLDFGDIIERLTVQLSDGNKPGRTPLESIRIGGYLRAIDILLSLLRYAEAGSDREFDDMIARIESAHIKP